MGAAWELNVYGILRKISLQGPSSTGIQMDVLKRQEQLDLKEKELNAKEAELKRQQDQMIADGTLKPKKNWPKCYPVTRHDIAGEVCICESHNLDSILTISKPAQTSIFGIPIGSRKRAKPLKFTLLVKQIIVNFHTSQGHCFFYLCISKPHDFTPSVTLRYQLQYVGPCR